MVISTYKAISVYKGIEINLTEFFFYSFPVMIDVAT
jgi:hypothetical protein